MRLPDNNKLNFLVGVHVGFGDVLTGGVVIGLNSGVVKNITEKGIYAGLPAKKLLTK